MISESDIKSMFNEFLGKNNDIDNDGDGNSKDKFKKKEIENLATFIANNLENIYNYLNIHKQKNKEIKLVTDDKEVKENFNFDKYLEEKIKGSFLLEFESSSSILLENFLNKVYGKIVEKFVKEEGFDGVDIIYLSDELITSFLIENKIIKEKDRKRIYGVLSEILLDYILNEKILNKSFNRKIKLIIDLNSLVTRFDLADIVLFSNSFKQKSKYIIPLDIVFLKDKLLELDKKDISLLQRKGFGFVNFEKEIINNLLYNYFKEKLSEVELNLFKELNLPKIIISEYVNFKENKLKELGVDLNKLEELEENSIDEFNYIILEIAKEFLKESNIIDLDEIGLTKEDVENIKRNIKKKLIGQDLAINLFFDKFYNYMLIDKNNRVFSSFFMGPTGVGKTYFVKLLAKELGWKFIRKDMGEFSESHKVSSLLGAPAGYTGYGDKTFVDEIKGEKHTIILFDEIEKAHPEILKIFLSFLDEGVITDSKGEKAIMRGGHIVIFTSNVFTSVSEIKEKLFKLKGEKEANNFQTSLDLLNLLTKFNITSSDEINEAKEKFKNKLNEINEKIKKLTKKKEKGKLENNENFELEELLNFKNKLLNKYQQNINNAIENYGKLVTNLGEKLKIALKETNKFKPEFVNRIDYPVLFNPIKGLAKKIIIDLEYEKILKKIGQHNKSLYELYKTIFEENKEKIYQTILNSKDVEEMGGRGIEKALSDLFSTYLSKAKYIKLYKKFKNDYSNFSKEKFNKILNKIKTSNIKKEEKQKISEFFNQQKKKKTTNSEENKNETNNIYEETNLDDLLNNLPDRRNF